ncbi:MAG TPA: ribonuclease HI [Gemmatimonadetes bacterium]|nr:ribonuclease HI [Gemmatimonadota bacterium]
MPQFTCTVCDESFNVPSAALEKFPGWEPKYCREHSPKKKGAGTKGAKKKSTAKKPRPTSSSKEENLTRAEVLEKYTDGLQTGVFTDGSSHPNPGPGGWGFVWVTDGEIEAEGHGGEAEKTTNNRMEFTALIEAYEALPEDASVTVFSDSQLCVNTITKWAPGWEKKGWKRKGDPLKNLDLVKRLLALYRAHPDCPLEWVRAHAGYRWNEYADSLATAWRRDEL